MFLNKLCFHGTSTSIRKNKKITSVKIFVWLIPPATRECSPCPHGCVNCASENECLKCQPDWQISMVKSPNKVSLFYKVLLSCHLKMFSIKVQLERFGIICNLPILFSKFQCLNLICKLHWIAFRGDVMRHAYFQ